jgi:hypothetical protein
MDDKLQDVGSWPDQRLIDMVTLHAGQDVAVVAAYVLKLRHGLEKIARGDYCTPNCTAYLKAMALLSCPHTPACKGCSPVHGGSDDDPTMELPAALSTLESLNTLRVAAADCGTNTDNPDTCGVCHKHFDDCEADRVWQDDTAPMTLETSFAACPGARVRAVLARMASP